MDYVFLLKTAGLSLLVPVFLPVSWFFFNFYGRTDKETKKMRIENASAFFSFALMMFAILSQGYFNKWSFFNSIVDKSEVARDVSVISFLVSSVINLFFGIYNFVLPIFVYEKKK